MKQDTTPLRLQEILKVAHRTCSKYHHNHSNPNYTGEAQYTFSALTLADFLRKIGVEV